MTKAFIYGVYHTRRPKVVLYVGSTVHPNQRLKQHSWSGPSHAMRILEQCPVTRRRAREEYWIAYWKQRNPRLKNRASWGSSQMTCRERFPVWFEPDTLLWLRANFQKNGIHASDYIRWAVSKQIERDKKK